MSNTFVQVVPESAAVAEPFGIEPNHEIINGAEWTEQVTTNESLESQSLNVQQLSTELGGSPRRLQVQGSKLWDPVLKKNVRLTGFNWTDHYIRDNEGAIMKQYVPGANVARIVALFWDNQPGASSDCMTNSYPYFKESCFSQLDRYIKRATDHGVWAILTARCQIGAGQNWQNNPNENFFHNSELRRKFFTAWQHVVNRYKSWDYIAAYEVMSEPRDKSLNASQVQQFYYQGCKAIAESDPNTPCMVGTRSFYKLWTLTDEVYMNLPNIIYTFDYFVPEDWSTKKTSKVTLYGHEKHKYQCAVLYPGWSNECCPNGRTEGQIFNDAWNRKNFQNFALSFRNKYNVPLFVNQWSVIYGRTEGNGRYDYIRDMAKLMQEYDIGWTWWTWRGGYAPYVKGGSSNWMTTDDSGHVQIDTKGSQAIAPYMSDRDYEYQANMDVAESVY